MSASDGVPDEAGPVVIGVCVSCRLGDGTGRPGEDLLQALRARQDEFGPNVSVRAVQCLSVCKRPCTVALSAPGRYTYVFGDLDPAAGVEDLVACAETYGRQENGFMLWRERPESLRRGIVARIPPVSWSADDGSHPR